MTTVSRTSQVTHSSVTGGSDWDHRLNRLLEDLQGTVVPEDTKSSGTEYREYRLTSSSRNNDDPPSKTEEKWIEYGSRGDHTPTTYHTHLRDHPHHPGHHPGHHSTTSTSSSSRTCQETRSTGGGNPSTGVKTYGIDPGLRTDSSRGRTTQIEYLTPANSTTVIKSGSTSPAPVSLPGPSTSLLPSSSPKVERKEFYAKASYTTLIKGGGVDGSGPIRTHDSSSHDRTIENFQDSFPPLQSFPQEQHQYYSPPPPPLLSSTKTSSESRREYSRTTDRRDSPGPRILEPLDPPMYTSTPHHHQHQTSSSYSSSRVNRMDEGGVRSVTPPPPVPVPADGLKTPPLIRKVMQQSESNYRKEVRTTGMNGRPLVTPTPVTYDPPPVPKPIQPATQYYTSTTTRTETRERDGTSPARQFPSQLGVKPTYGQPPKRLDELLATFDESYTETSKIGGDGGGPWKSTPYGPGTQPIRSVRIDENVQSHSVKKDLSNEGLTQRKPGTAPSGKSVSVIDSGSPGQVALYPPGPIYKGEEEALMAAREGEKGKAKMKMDRKYKAGEKSKSSHSERGGQGAAPVPVCLPICCAAPCVIM